MKRAVHRSTQHISGFLQLQREYVREQAHVRVMVSNLCSTGRFVKEYCQGASAFFLIQVWFFDVLKQMLILNCFHDSVFLSTLTDQIHQHDTDYFEDILENLTILPERSLGFI